jgi:hypothetical protein
MKDQFQLLLMIEHVKHELAEIHRVLLGRIHGRDQFLLSYANCNG